MTSTTMHSDRVSTTGSEGRKSSKPIMEKRRRARINASLAELKSLLLEVIKKEGARHSKMEKADILEMAVKHLRQIQRQQYTSGGADPTLSDKYRLGFNECAQEVSRYLGAADDEDAELRARLLNHLANCITSSDSPSPLSTPSSSPAPSGHVSSSTGSVVGGSAAGIVTPVPVRPVSKPGGVAGFSLIPQGGPSGGSPPSAAAVLVPTTTEINNNIATLANNNDLVSSAGSPNVEGGEVRTLNPAVGPATAVTTSQAASFPMAGTKVMGEVQVVGPKAAGGEVALVLPANVMTGSPLHSYIISLFPSPHALPAANLSLATAANAAHQASPGALSVPVMAATSHVSTAGTAPSLVTLTPGGAALSPTVLPPSSVGHVIAAGLNGPLTWQPANTVYAATTSTTSPPCSLSLATPQTSSSSLAGPALPPLASPTCTVTSEMRMSEDRIPALSTPLYPDKVSERIPGVISQASSSSISACDSSSAVPALENNGRPSLLHSQLMRPQPSVGLMPSADGSVWRPW